MTIPHNSHLHYVIMSILQSLAWQVAVRVATEAGLHSNGCAEPWPHGPMAHAITCTMAPGPPAYGGYGGGYAGASYGAYGASVYLRSKKSLAIINTSGSGQAALGRGGAAYGAAGYGGYGAESWQVYGFPAG